MYVKNHIIIWKILLPDITSSVVSGLIATLTTSVMLLTFAEAMGATLGMEFSNINETDDANYPNVDTGIILVGVVATILNRLVNMIQTRTVRWYL